MDKAIQSRVFHFGEARAGIPGPAGEHAVGLLHRGTLDVKLSLPPNPNRQAPHERDEVYVVVRGRGFLVHDGKRDPVEAGDLAFVGAGIEHRFEDFTGDLAVWVVFFGPQGGEVPRRARREASAKKPHAEAPHR